MIEIIKSFFRKKDELRQGSIEIAGHKFTVLNPLKMPKTRQAAIYLGEYEREWGMTKKDLLAYDDLLAEKASFPENWKDDKDLVHQLSEKIKLLYNLIDTRRLLVQEDFQYKPFLKAAGHMILLDDENPDKIDNAYYSKKMKLCQESDEVLIFFLTTIRTFQQSMLSSFDISKLSAFYPPDHLSITEKKVLGAIQSTIF